MSQGLLLFFERMTLYEYVCVCSPCGDVWLLCRAHQVNEARLVRSLFERKPSDFRWLRSEFLLCRSQAVPCLMVRATKFFVGSISAELDACGT